MRHSTLYAVCVGLSAATCVSAGAAGIPDMLKGPSAMRHTPARKAEAKAPARLAAKAADAASLWCAQTQKAFGWNGDEWELVETYKIAYDDEGRKTHQTVTDVEGYVNDEEYTWNDNGQLASRLTRVAEAEGEALMDYSRLKREYDSRLTSFITLNEQQIFNNGQWMPSNCYTQTITRDDAGNVTKMERAVFFDGVYDPVYRLEIAYGADGRACEMAEYELTYDYFAGEYAWVCSGMYTDIVWDRTDGQIVGLDDLDDLFIGANRIKSFTMADEDIMMDFSVVYDGDDFVVTAVSEEDEDGLVQVSTMSYNVMDFSADAEMSLCKGWKVETAMKLKLDDEVMAQEVITETYIYSQEDLVLLEKVEYTDGEISLIDSMLEGEVERDPEYGYPVAWTINEYDWETEEMMKAFRAEFSDYVGVGLSGISNPAAEASAPVFYNLQGLKVENPSAGIYIRVDGRKAGKVVVR